MGWRGEHRSSCVGAGLGTGCLPTACRCTPTAQHGAPAHKAHLHAHSAQLMLPTAHSACCPQRTAHAAHLCGVVVLALAALLEQVLQPAPAQAAVDEHQVLKRRTASDSLRSTSVGSQASREHVLAQMPAIHDAGGSGHRTRAETSARQADPTAASVVGADGRRLVAAAAELTIPVPTASNSAANHRASMHAHRSSGAGSVSSRRAI